MRDIIALECTTCKRKNYTKTKNRKTVTEKIQMNKHCRHCRKHVPHKETKT